MIAYSVCRLPYLCYKARFSKTSLNRTTNTELQSNIWMMYIEPSGKCSVCNHRITEHERIKHKVIPVFLKSLKYREGPKESLFQFLSPDIPRIWFVHSLDMCCVNLPAVVCVSKMSLRMLNYFYKYFDKIVCPIKLESHHSCRAYLMHFCEHI